MKIFTGIGSRKTPKHIQSLMTIISFILSEDGYVLRSGGANGADLAFEGGSTNKEIFLPFLGFNGSNSKFSIVDMPIYETAKKIMVELDLHPKWSTLEKLPQDLHARNVCQILGEDLNTPTGFVVCWTPDGANGRTVLPSATTGGTGTAIKLASKLGIPVLNLNDLKDVEVVVKMVGLGRIATTLTEMADIIPSEDLSKIIELIQ